MTAENDTQEKPRPRLLGEYLSCSRGSIRMAMQKKRETKVRGNDQKRIGKLLVDLAMISEEDLQNALRRQRADRLGLCPVFESLNRAELTGIGNHLSIQSNPLVKWATFRAGSEQLLSGQLFRPNY